MHLCISNFFTPECTTLQLQFKKNIFWNDTTGPHPWEGDPLPAQRKIWTTTAGINLCDPFELILQFFR